MAENKNFWGSLFWWSQDETDVWVWSIASTIDSWAQADWIDFWIKKQEDKTDFQSYDSRKEKKDSWLEADWWTYEAVYNNQRDEEKASFFDKLKWIVSSDTTQNPFTLWAKIGILWIWESINATKDQIIKNAWWLSKMFWKSEDFYSWLLYAEEKDSFEWESKNTSSSLQMEKQKRIESVVWDDLTAKMEEMSPEVKKAWEEFKESFLMPIQQIEDEIEKLEAKKWDLVLEWDAKWVADIDAKIENLKSQENKIKMKYALWVDIKGDTLDDIYNDIRQTLWANYSDDQIAQIVNKKIKTKYSEAENYLKEYQKIATEYVIRSDNNIVTLTPNSISSVIEKNWVFVTDNDKETMFWKVYWDFAERLENAKGKWWNIEKIEKIKMNLVNEFVESTFEDLFVSEWDADVGKDLFTQMMVSDEMKALRDSILSDDTNRFSDENWNFDYVAFAKNLKSTEALFNYWWLLTELHAESNSAKKRKHAEESKWIRSAYNTIAYLWYEKINKKYEQYYSEYKDSVDKYWKNSMKSVRLWVDMFWSMKALIDDKLADIKRKDTEYSQNSIYRAWDWINTLLWAVSHNKAETAEFVWSMLIPFVWTAWKITKWLEVASWLESISNPIIKTMVKVWSTIWWEALEWTIIWSTLDSFWSAEADARRLFLDWAVWVLKSIPLIQEWVKAVNIKSFVDDVSKWLKEDWYKIGTDEFNRMMDDSMKRKSYWNLYNADWKQFSDFVKNWKVDYNELAKSIDMWRIKLAENTNPIEEIYMSFLRDEVDKWKINWAQLDYLYKKASSKYWDSFSAFIKDFKTWDWLIDKVGVVSKFLANQYGTMEELWKTQALKWVSELLKNTWVTKNIDSEYDRISTIIDKAMKSSTSAEKSVLEEAKVALADWRSEASLLPLYLASNEKNINWNWFKKKTAELNSMLRRAVNAWVATEVEWLYKMPKEFIENLNDPKKIADLISANEEEYRRFWVKTYSMKEYTAANEKALKDTVGEAWYKKIKHIINTVDNVNAWKVKIYELPDSIKKMITGIDWFTTFVKEWADQKIIIGTVWWLVDIISDEKKLLKKSNIEYVKTMCHEIGHNIMLWLKPKIRNSLFAYTDKLLWIEINKSTIKNILPNASKERVAFLSTLSNKRNVLAEEMSADMLSDALQNFIFWKKWSTKDVGDYIMSRTSNWWVLKTMLQKQDKYDMLATKFISMVESMYNGTKLSSDPEELKWIMYYVAANILEWNRGRTKKWKISFSAITENQKYFFLKNEWDKSAFLKEWLSNFDSAEVFSEWVVREYLFDENMTSEHLWAIIPLTYRDAWHAQQILEWIWENTKEYAKFYEALQFAETKHWIALNNIQKFRIAWKLDTKLVVDGHTLGETLNNVSAKITRQWAYETSIQDMVKFVNMSDNKSYKAISIDYMNTMSEMTDKGVLKNVDWFFEKLWVEWWSFWEKYTDFVKKVEDKITDIAKSEMSWASKIDPSEISKDVVSRLIVWADWYISMLNEQSKFIKNTDNFIDELAYWLVRKNKFRSDWKHFNDVYTAILKWFDKIGLSKWSADTYSNILNKNNFDLAWKEFAWASYERKYYNYLSAKSTEALLQSFSKIDNISMDKWTFAKFIDKIWFGQSRYEVLLDNKMKDFGVLDQLDLWQLAFAKDRKSIIDVYKEQIWINKKLIWDKKSEEILKYLDSLEKKWMNSSDVDFFLKDMSRKMWSFWKWMTTDWFFKDVLTKDELLYNWKNKKDSALLGLTDVNRSEELLKSVSELEKPSTEEAINSLNLFLDDYSKMVDDMKAFWFEESSALLAENDLFKPFFNIDWREAKISINDNWYRFNTKYKLNFDNDWNTAKKNTLTTWIWALTNPATVAEVDKKLWKTLFASMENMNKNFRVYDWAIKSLLENNKIEWKFISKKSFMSYFYQEAEQHVRKWWLTFDKLIDDISNTYNSKYHKFWSSSYIWSNANPESYKMLVDSYVEILSKNHKTNWLYKLEVDWKVVLKNEIKSILTDVWGWNDWKLLWSMRWKSLEVDKIIWLGWNWLWMSMETIWKVKDKAALFHSKMFNNFLFKSFASTDSTFNWIDSMMKVGRKVERWTANAQYAMFYSLFWPWRAAMSQQQFSNMIHKFWKVASEMWIENIDDSVIKELYWVADWIMWSELTKIDLLADRPELIKTLQWQNKSGKLWEAMDRFLQLQSWLSRTDKSIESSVKKYALASALLENWYQWGSASKFMDWIKKIFDDFDAKWYEKYVSLDNLIKYNNDNTMRTLSYKITKEVENWVLSIEEWRNILKEIKWYSKDVKPLWDIIQNAKVKNMTFFQMSSVPELVQNHIWWWAWVANMRFLNWASRKAWDYSFKVAHAIMNKDMQALQKIVSQVAWEGMYAWKLYMYMNNQSEWWVDSTAFFNSMFLPFVVMNMTMLNLPENIMNISWGRYDMMEWESSVAKISNYVFWMFHDTSRRLKWRIWTAPMYWLNQFTKVYNWMLKLDENKSAEDVYSTKVAWIPIARTIAEVFSNIMQSRVWRFNTDVSAWIYRNYLGNSNKNYLLNFMSNAKMTDDVVSADALKNNFYELIKKEEWWFTAALELLWYQVDNKFAVRAYEQFYKTEWLEQFNWWNYVWKLLDKLDMQIDDASIEKTLMAEWVDYSEIQKMLTTQIKDSRSEFNMTDAEAKKLSDYKYKPFDLIVSAALMNSSSTDKSLVALWQWTTKWERDKFFSDVNDLVATVEEEIMNMEAVSPWLIKAAAYDPSKILKTIVSWKWKFWEQQRIWAILKAVSNANKTIIKESYKVSRGKDWYKKNSKTEEFKVAVEKENSKFNRNLAKNVYNTVLLGNQTLATRLQNLYTNTSDNSPLKNKLTAYSSLWTYMDLNLLEKNITSQWLSSVWVNNPYAEITNRIWNHYNWLEPSEKEETLPKILWFLNQQLDDIDWYVDPITARNLKVGIAAWNVDNMTEIGKDPELLERVKDDMKNFLDRVTVSEPLTDEKILEDIKWSIFKSWWTSKKKAKKIKFNLWKLAWKLNKMWWFKQNFYEAVLGKVPLENNHYKTRGSSIIPLKVWTLEAKKRKTKYSFITVKQPESEKTPDIVVKKIKISKKSWSYKWKSIKWKNVYKVTKKKRW